MTRCFFDPAQQKYVIISKLTGHCKDKSGQVYIDENNGSKSTKHNMCTSQNRFLQILLPFSPKKYHQAVIEIREKPKIVLQECQ